MLLSTFFQGINCEIERIALFLISHCKENSVFAFNFTATGSMAASCL